MSRRNLKSPRQLSLRLDTTSKRLPYRQPEVYSLGSLEQVQAYAQGYGTDATRWYYSA